MRSLSTWVDGDTHIARLQADFANRLRMHPCWNEHCIQHYMASDPSSRFVSFSRLATTGRIALNLPESCESWPQSRVYCCNYQTNNVLPWLRQNCYWSGKSNVMKTEALSSQLLQRGFEKVWKTSCVHITSAKPREDEKSRLEKLCGHTHSPLLLGDYLANGRNKWKRKWTQFTFRPRRVILEFGNRGNA